MEIAEMIIISFNFQERIRRRSQRVDVPQLELHVSINTSVCWNCY